MIMDAGHIQLLAVLFGVSTALLFLGLVPALMFLRRNLLQHRTNIRLQRRVKMGATRPLYEDGSQEDLQYSWWARLLHWAGSRRVRAEDASSLDPELPKLMAQAGYRGERALIMITGARGLLPVLGFALLIVFWLGRPITIQFWMLATVVVALGYLAPKWLIGAMARKRRTQLRDELPVLVDYLRLLQGVGLSLDQALLVTSEECAAILPVMSREISVLQAQMKQGLGLSSALEKMTEVLEVDDLSRLSELLIQMSRYGGEVESALGNFSMRMQEQQRLLAQEKVGQISGRLTVVMILFLFPALMIVTAGSAFLALIEALANNG